MNAKTSKISAKSKLDPQTNGRIAVVAAQMPTTPPGTRPPVLGSRMRIWKQDPSVSEIAIRDVYVHTSIHSGPSDSQIKIAGLPIVNSDTNGDFLFDPSSNEAFDAVHTYTVVRQVLTMYQRVLGDKMKWQWNTSGNSDPISVLPHAGETENAFYCRRDRAIKFFFFRPQGAGQNEPMVFTCRSFDIVSHEVGHAILDALQPDWLSASNPLETRGLHESFGDLTSIFLVLSQFDQVEFIVSQTKSDLHQKNILSAVGEQFGMALGRPAGLRNADNDLKMSQVSNEVYDISKVFTGGVYDALADAFTAGRGPRIRNDAEVLYEVGRNMSDITIQALKAAPSAEATYADVVNGMIKIAKANPIKYPDYDIFLRKQFESREVLGPNAVTVRQEMTGFAPSISGCCGTMKHIEHGDE